MDPAEATATFLRERRTVVEHNDLVGAPFRDALSGCYDRWLADLLVDRPGYALVAVGGLGRREVTARSDLDLVLLHDGARADVPETADRIWYAVWDAKVRLDHSVRTVPEAVEVAGADLRAALGLLDARHLAGDPDLTRALAEAARGLWRTGAPTRLEELMASQRDRWQTHGEVAFLLEPQLKDGRGGLRDVHALAAVAAAQAVDVPYHRVRHAYRTLLDVRGELHRAAGRATDVLQLEQQDEVAATLGYPDADAMARAVSAAGRAVSFVADQVQRTVGQWTASRGPRPPRLPAARRPGARAPERRPLAEGVVEQAGEVVLARGADPATDPVLCLRVAAAAARNDLPIAPYALERIAAGPTPPEPWPTAARQHLVRMLSAGPAAVRVVEALDQVGLLVRLVPEWEHVRFLPQRNPVHTFTVDRHLVTAAVHAAGRTRRVSRPDLLLVGALLHDIGKGYPQDHTVVGMRLVAQVAPRLGFPPEDVATLVRMVEHHLLLPDVATRRDLDDPATIEAVASAVGGSLELLELLAALTESDALATGPGAWSEWKAGLVRSLVRRTATVLAGGTLPEVPTLTAAQEALARAGEVAVRVDGPEVTVAAPDQPGLLSRAAGVLALHRLDVHDAIVREAAGMAVLVFHAEPRYGTPPDPSLVRADLVRALEGGLPLAEALERRESAYRRPPRSARVAVPPAQALWVDGAATGSSVLEVRCEDALGLLHRITGALEESGLNIVNARVSTLGAAAVDAFYVRGLDGGPVTDDAVRRAVADRVLAAVAP